MDSADKQKIVGTSIFFGMLLIYLSNRLPEEVVFPGHATYFIITFYLTYPDSFKIRHFLMTFLLSFGEIMYIKLISNYYKYSKKDLVTSKTMTVLLIEYLLIFFISKMVSKKGIYVEFSSSVLRTIIFLLEGYLKAKRILESLDIVTDGDMNQERFVQGLLVCGLQSCIPGLVYLIDTFFCLDIPLRDISIN